MAASRRYYIVIRADGQARLVSRYPRLRSDEVAYPMLITLPSGWGQTAQTTIELRLPEGVATAVPGDEPILPSDQTDDDGDADEPIE